MTDKNRTCLQQFEDGRKLHALLDMPDRVFNLAVRQDDGHRMHAVDAAMALAVAIELELPLRAHNLVALRLDRHFKRVDSRLFLSIEAEETKNENPIESELSPSLTRLVDIYIQRFRPRLSTTRSPFLFPGPKGGPRPPGGFGSQLSRFLAEEAGVTMTPHQFRHLAAKLYLDHFPEGFETVRLLLGHKDRSTTERFYREMNTMLASRRYSQFLQAQRDAERPRPDDL
jgi:integrase